MGAGCCDHGCETAQAKPSPRYRRVLWIALAVNLTMFAVETLSGFFSGSVSLLADSMDFLSDGANYGISLWVLGAGLALRARASRVKAWSMAAIGMLVLGNALWHALRGGVPEASVMGGIATLALLANLGVAALLYGFREGDSNMRSVWICTRNDALGNIAVMLAALGVFGTGSAWPDLLVALIMASLSLSGAWQILRHAGRELGTVASLGR